jgi:hypothetical protein
VAPQQQSTRSYATGVHLETQSRNTMQAEKSNQGSADNRFILGTGKHKNGCAVNKITNQIPMASKKSRTPMFGERKTTMLHVIVIKRISLCHVLVLK